MKKITTLITIIVSLLLTTPDNSQAQNLWQTIAPDLQITRAKTDPDSFFSSEILLIRTTSKKFETRVIRASDYGSLRSSVKKLCHKSGAVACINANFFDENNHPLGLVISKGTKYQPIHKNSRTITGVFQVNRNGVDIVHYKEFKPQQIIEAIQAGPRLLANGKLTNLKKGNGTPSRRSSVCIDSEKRILFAISTGFTGITLTEFQSLLSKEGLSCKEALNLDGGSSSQFFLSGNIPGAISELQEISIQSIEEVPVALGLFIKQ